MCDCAPLATDLRAPLISETSDAELLSPSFRPPTLSTYSVVLLPKPTHSVSSQLLSLTMDPHHAHPELLEKVSTAQGWAASDDSGAAIRA